MERTWRRGGDQIIPRPEQWRLGDPPHWHDRHDGTHPISLHPLLETVRARGLGSSIDPVPTDARASAVLIALWEDVDGTEVLPFAPVGSLIIDDPELAAWTHRQLTPHPVACYTKPIRLHNPAGNGRPMTYIACTKPRYPVSAGMHEKVQAMPHVRFRPIEAGHNCIISAPDLVAQELLAVPG